MLRVGFVDGGADSVSMYYMYFSSCINLFIYHLLLYVHMHVHIHTCMRTHIYRDSEVSTHECPPTTTQGSGSTLLQLGIGLPVLAPAAELQPSDAVLAGQKPRDREMERRQQG